MIVRLGQKLNTAGARQRVEGADDLRGVCEKLFQEDAGDTVCNFEPAVVSADKVENQAVGGEVTLVGDLSADFSVFAVIEIMLGIVKNGIVSQPTRLMNLKVKTDRSHSLVPVENLS